MDKAKRATTAGEDIEGRLSRKDVRGAWEILGRWYKDATGRAPKPTTDDITLRTEEYVELYRNRDRELPSRMVRVMYRTVNVNDTVPTV